MRPSEYGPRQHNKRRVTVLQRVVLLLERWIWYPLWKSTWLYSVARRFKLTRLIPELPTSQCSSKAYEHHGDERTVGYSSNQIER
ncbi:hypothetical protein Golax_025377 [Gossypium laxum]|uniref:Uncharacterized protein n=1 Tax=Gossypium laxum TaxID=34288 RepID=A0A7J9B1Q9_9ROSI|nr:hypothetical protein [Gossypium laxum]